MRSLLALALLLLWGCSGRKPQNTQAMSSFDKQGHRGCRALMPENTIPAMIKALELGVTTLETDAVITKDSQVVLSHEPFFNHEITTKPNGAAVSEAEEKSLNIYHMSYGEVVRYDVGLKPHPRFPLQQKMAVSKPLLATMIDSAEAYCRRHDRPLPDYNIETKTTPATDDLYHPAPEAFVDRLINVIDSKGIGARVVIQSFDVRTLQYLHRRYPHFRTALLIEDFDKRDFETQLQRLGFTPTIYSPHYSLATQALVDECHRRSIKIIPWTVDDEAAMRALVRIGVDGIITDDPGLFARAGIR